MKGLSALFIVLCVGSLIGCTSPEKRKAGAEAEMAEQKLEAVKEYRACLKRYEGKPQDPDPCAKYKEAAETLAK